MKRTFFSFLLTSGVLFLFSQSGYSYPEYSAFSGSNCMACHTGPVGGFGRKPLNIDSPGYITDKVSVSGNLQFLLLSDQREGSDDRVVLFPMEGALHVAWKLYPTLTLVGSQDFGFLREAYGMLHNESESMYLRIGFFTLPYGLLFADHTSFIKEGRVEAGQTTFEERGLGAGLFGARYKDSGMELGLSGRWFINLAFTSGVIGQEERAFPSSQGGNKKSFTRRAGFITNNFSLGASVYNNDNEVADRRILRYGGFGWIKAGPFALLFEHDEGEDEKFTVSGSTQSRASYLELVWGFPFPVKKWTSYLKTRWEQLDPNRSLENDRLQRWVYSYRFNPMAYLSFEAFYRQNKEEPIEKNNDDILFLTHIFF